MNIYVKCDTIKDGCINGKCPYLNPVLVDEENYNDKCPFVPEARIKNLTKFMLCSCCVNYIFDYHVLCPDKIIKCWNTNYKFMRIKV